MRGRPPSPRDRFAGEVDHRVRPIDFACPRAGIADVVPRRPDDGARRELRCGSAREDDDVVTIRDEALGQRPTEKSGAARDDDLHLRNQNTE